MDSDAQGRNALLRLGPPMVINDSADSANSAVPVGSASQPSGFRVFVIVLVTLFGTLGYIFGDPILRLARRLLHFFQ
jgi:hypothetical protein